MKNNKIIKSIFFKKIILIFIILISGFSFSQNFPTEIEMRKRSNIKRTKIYEQNLINSEETKILTSDMLFDKEGREIECKRFSKNGEISQHYSYEYLIEGYRNFIILDDNGNEIKRNSQGYNNKNLTQEHQKKIDKFLKFKYYKKKNMSKIWITNNNIKQLKAERFYNESKLIIKTNVFYYKNNDLINTETRIYQRDEKGNTLNITILKNGISEVLEIHEHEEFST